MKNKIIQNEKEFWNEATDSKKISELWWEDEMDKMLYSFVNNEYVNMCDVKLLVTRIIETEKGLIYPPVKYGKNERDMAKKLRSEGKSLREIGKIMGIKGAQSVNNLIK